MNMTAGFNKTWLTPVQQIQHCQRSANSVEIILFLETCDPSISRSKTTGFLISGVFARDCSQKPEHIRTETKYLAVHFNFH
jgi:hypothetical protein